MTSTLSIEVHPVLNAIARTSARLCEAGDALIYVVDGDQHRLVAKYGRVPQPQRVGDTHAIRRDTPLGRAVLDRRPIHVKDIRSDVRGQFRGLRAVRIQVPRVRTILALPLVRDGVAVGGIVIRRTRVRPFSPKQIALLKTFADQAVIAIENVRLFTELQEKNNALTAAHAHVTEALEQQTATSEILRIISSSPTDVQPVFDTIVRSATQLCAGLHGVVLRYDGDLMHLIAQHGFPVESLEELRQRFPQPPSRDLIGGRAITERRVIHIPDLGSDPAAPADSVAIARIGGYRSLLAVPMMRGRDPIGCIVVSRGQAAFSDNQIALVETFAEQAVIAIENVRLFKALESRNRDLTEALEQQTATADVLKVISRSTFDLQPVLATLVENATRLAGAEGGLIARFDGEVFRFLAEYGASPEFREYWRTNVIRPGRGSTIGRAAIERRIVHIVDVTADPEHELRDARRISGQRSVLGVPMLRQDDLVGVFFLWRTEVRAFTDKQIDLVATFADQAVIAIENVRLFTELQEKNQALTEAHAQVTESLGQQTATSEILRVIASSPTDVQPVFDTLARSAMHLCDANFCNVVRYDGELLHLTAHAHVTAEAVEAMGRIFPMRPGRSTVVGRAVLQSAVVHLPDVQADAEFAQPLGAAFRGRSALGVPMLRDDVLLGVIAVGRAEPGLFSDKQIALLKTFADQAVIAIENVRLFTELQASNRELTTALDTQTATSDILRVISRSQTDVQPVFDTIVESVVQLCDGVSATVYRFDGDLIHLIAHHHSVTSAVREVFERVYPLPPSRTSVVAQAILDRAVIHVRDFEDDPAIPSASREMAQAVGHRSLVAVPMLRGESPIGAISVGRRGPHGAARPFSDSEITVLKTFADQAVIAIENVRLFKELDARTQELTRSVGELRALGEVGQAISSTLDLRTVLSTIVTRATELSDTDAGVIYEYDEQREVFVLRATAHLEAEIVETMLSAPVRKGEGVTGRLAEVPEPIQVPDILEAPAESRVRGTLVRAGYRALLAVPLVREDHLLGGLTVLRKATGAFTPEVVELLQTFATQSALAIQNARLFLEIEDKSRQLEAASQHKSEFLANMSHELRTPLNAIIGFSEVLGERMFGELNAKQEEYLKDIHASGQHLLSLINDILDLSKIEAGRMELELTDFHLPTALDNALTLVRERAGRRGISLNMTAHEHLDYVRADERKIKQVLLNLLSNAIKFTPEGGRISVVAKPVDGAVEVSVSDTGVGIAPEDQEAIFEEFRQVGTADKKVEGTGLGLALSRKFVELHGGRIWVESQVGAGSTFTFSIPMRQER